MYLVVIFGQIHTLHTLHTLHKSRGFWRVENSYLLPLPLLSKNPGGLDYPCHSLHKLTSSDWSLQADILPYQFFSFRVSIEWKDEYQPYCSPVLIMSHTNKANQCWQHTRNIPVSSNNANILFLCLGPAFLHLPTHFKSPVGDGSSSQSSSQSGLPFDFFLWMLLVVFQGQVQSGLFSYFWMTLTVTGYWTCQIRLTITVTTSNWLRSVSVTLKNHLNWSWPTKWCLILDTVPKLYPFPQVCGFGTGTDGRA